MLNRSLARLDQALSRRGGRAPGNLGMRIGPCGVFSDFTTGASGTTWNTTLALSQDFDAVQLIFAQGSTTVSGAVAATVAAQLFTISDQTTSPASYNSVAATFAGTSSGTVPLGSAAGTLPTTTRRRSFLVSDLLPLSSVARADGGTLPLLQVRTFVSNTSAPINIMGGSAAPYNNLNTVWNTHASGRTWKNQVATGDLRATSFNGWASGTLSTQCPLYGVIYYARGQVVNVATFGDSIEEGQDPAGEGFVFPACVNLSSKAGVTVEHSCLAWSGANFLEVRSLVLDGLVPGFPIDLAVVPGWTPNGVTSGTITAGTINVEQQMTAIIQGLLKAKGIPVVVLTGMPINTGTKAWASSDSVRRSYNTAIKALAPRGVAVVDLDGVMAGVDDGTGQIQIATAYNLDGTHPNNAGNMAVVPRTQLAIAAAISAGGGGVF